MTDSEMAADTSSLAPSTASELSPFDSLWEWLINEPWRVVVVAGLPCLVIILLALVVGCCCLSKRGKEDHSAPRRGTADDDSDSKGLPSAVNGSALEMITIEALAADTAETACPTMGDSLISPLGASFPGDQDDSSFNPPALPTNGPTNEEQHNDTDCSLLPKPRSFKQRRTGSTSNEQKTLAYVEVELNPVTEENKDVIIVTETPTQYAKIAGVYKPFSPK